MSKDAKIVFKSLFFIIINDIYMLIILGSSVDFIRKEYTLLIFLVNRIHASYIFG